MTAQQAIDRVLASVQQPSTFRIGQVVEYAGREQFWPACKPGDRMTVQSIERNGGKIVLYGHHAGSPLCWLAEDCRPTKRAER